MLHRDTPGFWEGVSSYDDAVHSTVTMMNDWKALFCCPWPFKLLWVTLSRFVSRPFFCIFFLIIDSYHTGARTVDTGSKGNVRKSIESTFFWIGIGYLREARINRRVGGGSAWVLGGWEGNHGVRGPYILFVQMNEVLPLTIVVLWLVLNGPGL